MGPFEAAPLGVPGPGDSHQPFSATFSSYANENSNSADSFFRMFVKTNEIW